MLHAPILFTPLANYDVVIPCHNRAHVVADAVASVLAQDPPPVRVSSSTMARQTTPPQ